MEARTQTLSFAAILKHSPEELDRLYRASRPSPFPDGDTRGVAARHPGSVITPLEQLLLSAFWGGKVFRPNKDGTAELLNKTPLGRIIPARGLIGDSLIDGRKTIVIDYSANAKMPLFGGLISRIRDEIRCVAPDLYLGYAFIKRRGDFHRALYFALDSSKNTISEPVHSEAAPALLAP